MKQLLRQLQTIKNTVKERNIMSAKLLKSLAKGSCMVRNTSRSEVIIYWKDDRRIMQHRVIRPGESRDLLKEATVKQLRASVNLKDLFSRQLLSIVAPGV